MNRRQGVGRLDWVPTVLQFATSHGKLPCIRAILDIAPTAPRYGAVAIAMTRGNLEALSALDGEDVALISEAQAANYAIASNYGPVVQWAVDHGVQFGDEHAEEAYRHGNMESYLTLVALGFRTHSCVLDGKHVGGARVVFEGEVEA